MKPQDDYRNGDVRGWCAGGASGGGGGGGGSGGGSASGSDDEGSEASCSEELSLEDAGAPARALAALNALRKSRQHYDCVLVADGAEVAAHRAVLAAASPYLLEALAGEAAAAGAGAGAGALVLRAPGVDAEALRTLVEYAYTGRARVREAAAARRLYRAAWRLRVEPVRAHLAERLARRPAPPDALELRALPDLEPHLLAHIDAYIAQNFDEICETGALATLPKINIEMLRESSAEDGEETAVAVAAAALTWLRDRQAADVDLEELCSRTHLLFVDARGELRDCGELPATRDEAPELGEYRREAAERERGARRRDAARPPPKEAKDALGARQPRPGGADACAVIAARPGRAPGRAHAPALRARRRRLRRPARRVRRLRPRARAALHGGVRPGHQRVGAAGRHARRARALPGGAERRRAVGARRQRRPQRPGLGGRAARGRVGAAGAAAAGAHARGGGGGRPGRAVRGRRLGGRAEPAPRGPLPAGRAGGRGVVGGAAAGDGPLAVRGRGVGGRAVGAGRLRRVALPGVDGDAAAGRRRGRLGGGPGAADGAALGGRRRVARPAGVGGRLGRRGVAAAHGLAAARRGGVARRPRPAPRPRRAGARRARRRALRRRRLRRQGVPLVRRVPARPRPGLDLALGEAAGPADDPPLHLDLRAAAGEGERCERARRVTAGRPRRPRRLRPAVTARRVPPASPPPSPSTDLRPSPDALSASRGAITP